MNERDGLNANPGRDFPLALSCIAGAAISTGPWYFSRRIFSGMSVTFVSWHTYPAIKSTVNGEFLGCPRVFGKQGKLIAAGEGIEDE